MLNKFQIRGLFIVLVAFLTACPPPQPYVPVADDYKAYLLKDRVDSASVHDKYSAYFDFSGVFPAYEDSATNLTFNGMTQKITGSLSKYDVYSLANDSVMLLSDVASPAALFKKLKDSNQHGKLYAPIEKALKKIVAEDRSALLVTDFEEYTRQGGIYTQSYATPYFEEWLGRGKSITFFVTNYKEVSKNSKGKNSKNAKLQGKDKHLYYAVFDDNNGELLKEIEAGLEGCPKNYQVFTLSNTNYTVYTKYGKPNQGGTYHDENGDDIVTSSVEDGSEYSFFAIKDMNVEVYTFCQTWTDIITNAKAMSEPGITPQFEHLLHNLFVDFSKFDSYTVNSFKVSVTEVEDDFRKYVNGRRALQYKPVTREIEGEKIVEIPMESKDFYDESGTLLEYCDYEKGSGKINKVEGLLDFAQSLFDKTYQQDNGKETELGIDINSNANGKETANFGKLLKVDIQFDKTTPNIGQFAKGEKLYDMFYWDGNDCLYMAVKNVLQHSCPDGRTIYTYFINQQ